MGSDASCAFRSRTGSPPGFLRQVQLPPRHEESGKGHPRPSPTSPHPAAWGFVYPCGYVAMNFSSPRKACNTPKQSPHRRSRRPAEAARCHAWQKPVSPGKLATGPHTLEAGPCGELLLQEHGGGEKQC